MKFTEHTKVKIDETCTVLWNHEDKKVSDMPTKTIHGEKYYELASGDDVKRREGASYKEGDTFYLKENDKTVIIKEEYDHWRALARVHIFNGDEHRSEVMTRTGNIHIRCW